MSRIRNIEKLAELYEKLKVVDRTLVLLNRLADQVATDQTPLSIKLSKCDNTGQSAGADHLYDSGSMFHPWLLDFHLPPRRKDRQDPVIIEVDDIVSLQLIGVILGSMMARREELKAQILTLQ